MSKRLTIIQPYLPHYSAKFFTELAKRPQFSNVMVLADMESSGDLNTNVRRECYDVVHIPTIRRLGFVFRPGRLRALLRHPADVYMYCGDPRDFGAIFSAVFLRLIGRKVVFWGMFHRIGGPRRISQIAYALMARVSHVCISYAKVGAFNLLSVGARSENVFVGGTAIEENKSFTAAAGVSADDVKKFKIDRNLDQKKVILQVVRLSEIKKPLLLLELANVLRERGRRDFVIVAIGGGELANAFETRVQELNLNEFVRMLPAEYDEDTLAHWFLSADVFTIPTCIGLSVHHAFSYGVPVVTDNSISEQASEYEILADGLNGLTYDAGDMAAYGDAIEAVLDDPELRSTMSRNAVDTVKNTYSLSAKVKSFEVALSRLWCEE